MFGRNKEKISLNKIQRKLKNDLQEAEFSKNWEEKQKINLKLLWIDFVKKEGEIMSHGLGLSANHPLFDRIRDGEDAYFPESFDSNDPLQDKFAEKIVRDYGAVMANPGKYAKCLYRPISQLPFPKEYIKRAWQFMSKQLNSEHPNWERPDDADEFIRNMDALAVYLPNFVEISETDLPTDTLENVKVGMKFARD